MNGPKRDLTLQCADFDYTDMRRNRPETTCSRATIPCAEAVSDTTARTASSPHPRPLHARAVADTSPRYSRDRAGATRRWKLNNSPPAAGLPSRRRGRSAGLLRVVDAVPALDADDGLAAANRNVRGTVRAAGDGHHRLVGWRRRRVGDLRGHRAGVVLESDAHGAARNLDAAGRAGTGERDERRCAALGELLRDGQAGVIVPRIRIPAHATGVYEGGAQWGGDVKW